MARKSASLSRRLKWPGRWGGWRAGVAALALAGLSACDWPVYSWLLDRWVEWSATPAGQSPPRPFPRANGRPEGQARPVVSATPSPVDDATAARVRANAELMQEMLTVVTLNPPHDPARFGGMVDTLNQGASLEGVYNGIVHSADYRELEQNYFGSSDEALTAFARELAQLEVSFPKPREFDGAAPRSLAVIDPMDAGSGAPIEPVMKIPAGADAAALAAAYRAHFAGASVFVLKRVLGDEGLRLVAFKQAQGRPALDDWYGKFAARTAGEGVDLGLALRNRADERFHRDWAARAPFDRLEWEVLNRLHRLLDAGEAKRKEKPAPRR